MRAATFEHDAPPTATWRAAHVEGEHRRATANDRRSRRNPRAEDNITRYHPELDDYYVEKATLASDIGIILITAATVFGKQPLGSNHLEARLAW